MRCYIAYYREAHGVPVKKYRRLIVFALIVTVLLVGLNFAAQFWLYDHKGLTPPDDWQIKRAAAYEKSPYWSQEFLRETRTANQFSYLGDDGFFANSFQGKWISFTPEGL